MGLVQSTVAFRSDKNFIQPLNHGEKGRSFGQSKMTKLGPTQEVYVVGPKGKNWLALYSFEQQEDGSWRISGCYLTKSDGFAA